MSLYLNTIGKKKLGIIFLFFFLLAPSTVRAKCSISKDTYQNYPSLVMENELVKVTCEDRFRKLSTSNGILPYQAKVLERTSSRVKVKVWWEKSSEGTKLEEFKLVEPKIKI